MALSNSLQKRGIDSQLIHRPIVDKNNLRSIVDRFLRRVYVTSSHSALHPTWRISRPPLLEKATIVHLHTVADWFDVPHWLLSLPTHVGVVVSLHDLWHVSGGCFVYRNCQKLSQNCQPCPILKYPANQVLATQSQHHKLKIYQKRNAQLVANSQWLASVAEQSPVARACDGIKIIPPSILTNIFKPWDRVKSRKEWKISCDKFVILTGCASLTDENKNTSWLLAQLAKLPCKEEILVIAFGDSILPSPPELNVRFVGQIQDRLRLARLMAAADVFVSASKMETYGLTLVESISCGTPVVAFETGGIPEAVPKNYGSCLVPRENGGAMLQAILDLKQNMNHLSPKIARASALIRERNCPDKFVDQYINLYVNSVSEY